METAPSATTTSCSASRARATEAEIKKAFRAQARELHPDVSEDPDAEERFKEVVEAYEVLSDPERRELYDRFGHAGLRSRGYTPTSFDFGTLGDLFSAFFGDDLFGVGGRPRGAARGADVAAEVAIELVDSARGVDARRPVPRRRRLRDLRRERRRAGHRAGHAARPAAAPGRVQEVSNTVFGQFVRAQACGRCGGAGRIVEHPCTDVRRRGPGRRGADAPGRHPARDPRRPADPARRRGPRRRARRPRRRPVRARPRPARPALRPRGARPDLDRRPDDDPGRARRDGRPCRRSTATSSSSSSRARSPARSACSRGAGMPVLQGRGRGDHRLLVNVAVPRRLTEEQRRLLEQFERSADEETYSRTRGSSTS